MRQLISELHHAFIVYHIIPIKCHVMTCYAILYYIMICYVTVRITERKYEMNRHLHDHKLCKELC